MDETNLFTTEILVIIEYLLNNHHHIERKDAGYLKLSIYHGTYIHHQEPGNHIKRNLQSNQNSCPNSDIQAIYN